MANRSKSAIVAKRENAAPDVRKAWLADARAVIDAEGKAVLALLERLDGGFCAAVERILSCKGRVVVTGMGKSGLVGQKISATLASTGTPSLFMHAADAVHGDIGRIKRNDIVLALSYSGESDELAKIVKPVKALNTTLIVLTGELDSTLAKHADVVISIGHVREACPMGLVPTASTTAMMVVGDALAMCLFNQRGLDREDYARFHPGGALGRKLMHVHEVMRVGDENPVAKATDSLRRVIEVMTQTAGRPGAASLIDGRGKLVGFFTDGDLRRLLEKPDFSIDVKARDIMHDNPKTVRPDQLVVEAARILTDHKIDQVPVVDDRDRPIGLLDVQDVLSTRVV